MEFPCLPWQWLRAAGGWAGRSCCREEQPTTPQLLPARLLLHSCRRHLFCWQCLCNAQGREGASHSEQARRGRACRSRPGPSVLEQALCVTLTWHKPRVEGHQAVAGVNLGVGPVGAWQALAKAVQGAPHHFLRKDKRGRSQRCRPWLGNLPWRCSCQEGWRPRALKRQVQGAATAGPGRQQRRGPGLTAAGLSEQSKAGEGAGLWTAPWTGRVALIRTTLGASQGSEACPP